MDRGFMLKYLVPIKPSKAKGLVAQVYSQIKKDFGRNEYNNPCPVCEIRDWCLYP
jgi:hypothetical protein